MVIRLKKQNTPEADDQKALVEWLRKYHPEILFTCSPAGFKFPKPFSIIFAKVAAAMGYSKGTPDLTFYAAKNGYYGLCIEMKRPFIKGQPRGTQEPEQKIWQVKLAVGNYKYSMCEGFYEAQKCIEWYYGLRSA